MNKEEAVRLVNEFGALTVHDSLYGNHFSVTESELLAFANACEKIGMEKAAIEAELRGKKIGKKYALMEAGNIAWDCGEKILAKRFHAMANEIVEI